MRRLEEVMKKYMVDFTERMSCIQEGLTASTNDGASSEQVRTAECLLEELMEIVESIDFARDLRSIGGLPVLKALVQGVHPSLRWRAADVIATCCQNNLPVQVCVPPVASLRLRLNHVGLTETLCRSCRSVPVVQPDDGLGAAGVVS